MSDVYIFSEVYRDSEAEWIDSEIIKQNIMQSIAIHSKRSNLDWP